jgi:peroxiredoxin
METTTPSKETQPIRVGERAPDFALKDQDGLEFKLSDHLGKRNVILFFYPLDWSPTCTSENVCFSQDLSRFSRYGEVAAISCDSVYSHKAWAGHLGLKHRLLSDMHRGAIKDYGLYLPAANVGRRATVVVGKDGRAAFVSVNEDIARERDYSAVESFLKTLGE